MKGDYVSSRVATGRAIIGLALQGAFAVAFLIYALFTRDHSAFTAFLYSVIGLPVWVVLAILFDQHRRERIEAMEAETISSTVGAGSVFDAESSAAEFRVAKTRLAGMYKFLVPGASVLIAALLIGVGLWRFFSAREAYQPDVFQTSRHTGWAVAVGLIIAVAGFIFARFVSGMAKQAVWANLRAGSAVAVGTALMGLAIAAGAFVDYVGPDIVARYVTVILPWVMVALGAEILLNLVLDLYRPRKAGEMPRPAFDSRVLGFVAAPDRIADSISSAINYQLGFDVSSSWFYQLLSRSLGTLVLLGVGVLWGLSCLAVVEPHERAIVTRFGALQREIEPGLHFKLPWPIDRVEVPPYTKKNEKGKLEIVGRTATGVRTIDVATPPPATATKVILWTNEHAVEEVYQIVQPSASDTDRAGDSRNRDVALVSVEIPMQYTVKNVSQFEQFAPVEHRDDLVKAIARREVIQYFSATSADHVLGGDLSAISSELTARVRGAFERAKAGIDVTFVGITGVHPPSTAAANYEKVVQAEQKRQARIEAAMADAIGELTKVVGSVELADSIEVELNSLERLRQNARAVSTPQSEAAVKEQEIKIQQLLEKAGGSAAEAVAQARADRWTKHMGERGRSSRYQGQIASFEASPELYARSAYFDALRAAIANNRLYITSDDIPNLWINADVKTLDNAANVFDPNRKKDE